MQVGICKSALEHFPDQQAEIRAEIKKTRDMLARYSKGGEDAEASDYEEKHLVRNTELVQALDELLAT